MGDKGTEKLGGNINFTSNWVQLETSKSYKIAIAHGEYGGGSSIRPWIMIPNSDTWHLIDPTDPTQAGFWRVPFDSSVANQLSPFTFFKHGGISSVDLQSGKFGFVHPLQGNNLSRASSVSLTNKTWYHLHNQVDLENGKAQLFVNGSLALSETFDSSLALKNDIESEWIIGSGTISSTVDEIRISNRARSSDWLLATYQNQKANPSFPTPPNALVGPPSFTSLKQFTTPAEKPFSHLVKATGQPTA